MVCSEYEFSADRAAAIRDGTADNIVRMCMAFAGFDKNVCGKANTAAFMQQGIEYKKMVKDDKRNKALEFMMFNQATHSLVAVRAYECTEWAKGETFANITALSKCVSVLDCRNALLPILKGYKYYVGDSYETVVDAFVKSGFNNVSVNRVTVCEKKHKPGKVVSISIDGNTSFDKGIWVPAKLGVI